MTNEELQALCETWQKRLGLADWTVRARFARQYEMDRSDITGQCRWVLSKREAVINILVEEDYPPSLVEPYNLERTLVHELIHLHFAPFWADQDSLEQILQEQAIDALAKALVP